MTDHRHPLTPRQREMLQHIERLTRLLGYPPSQREVGEAMGLRSMNGVHEMLCKLQRYGYLAREPYRSRSMRVLPAPEPPAPRSEYILAPDEKTAQHERQTHPEAIVVTQGPDGRWTTPPLPAAPHTIRIRVAHPWRGTP